MSTHGRSGVAMVVAGLTLLAGTWCGTFPNAAAADVSDQEPAQAPDPDAVLAVVNSRHGTLRLRGDSGRLTLTGVSARPVWFSDRPQRAAGTYSIQELIDVFFRDQPPPNAALDVSGAGTERHVIILELSKPEYTRSSGRFRFDVKVVNEPTRALGPSSQLRSTFKGADAKVPKSFGASALFVDSAAGDTTLPCQVPLYNGYVPNLVGISCSDAVVVAGMTDIPNNCANPQYFDIPNFGAWLCQGSVDQYVLWDASPDNFRSPDARFTMYPCSQNPPACSSQ